MQKNHLQGQIPLNLYYRYHRPQIGVIAILKVNGIIRHLDSIPLQEALQKTLRYKPQQYANHSSSS